MVSQGLEEVDIPGSTVTICNTGPVPVSVNFHIGWSTGEYKAPAWDKNQFFRGPLVIHPDAREELIMHGLSEDASLMVDSNDRIGESNEENNCVDAAAKFIACP